MMAPHFRPFVLRKILSRVGLYAPSHRREILRVFDACAVEDIPDHVTVTRFECQLCRFVCVTGSWTLGE